MFLYILKWSIIYFILIMLIHQLYIYFKKNLTITKTKDYFNYSNLEYNNINSIISQNNKQNINNLDKNITSLNNDKNEIMNNNVSNVSNLNNNLNSDNFDINNFNNVFEKNNAFLDIEKQSHDIKDELNDFLSNLNTK
jgi:hypothetical protein